MKFLTSTTLTACLLLSSCATFRRPDKAQRLPASFVFNGSCAGLAAQVVEVPYVPTEAESILEDYLGSQLLSKNLIEKYRYLIRESEVDGVEASLIKQVLPELPTDEKKGERLFSYVQFARSRGDEREKILKELPEVLSPEYKVSKNRWVKNFRKLEKKITNYIDKREIAHYNQLSKTTSDETRAKWGAFKAAYEEGKIYRSLSLKCSNKSISTTTPEQAKLLTRAFTMGSVGSAVATYSFINWDREKDGRWYGELGWTLFWASLFGHINGKYIFSNPNLKPWLHRLPLTFAVAASEDALISAAYGPVFNTLFGEKSEEKLKEIEAMKDDPGAAKILSELYQIMDKEGLFEKYEKEMLALFSKKDEQGNTVAMTLEEIQNIDPAELDIEAGQEMFLEAMAQQEYQQSMGPLSLGYSSATDRYTFHRMLDVLYVPINIQLGLVMNHQICMSADPKVGMLKAVSTFMAGKMMMDAFYFWSRRQAIGQ